MDLRIGYKDYTLKFVEGLVDRAEAVGMCFKIKGMIEIDKSLPDIETANTMLHEVMHAVHYVHGLHDMGQDTDAEERIVNSLGNGMTQVLRDNPEFTTTVMAKLGYIVIDEVGDE